MTDTITREYLDQKLDDQAEKILGVVKQGFDEINGKFTDIDNRFTQIDKHLVSLEAWFETLTVSVDRFSKIFTDLNQEVIVLRKQLREAEYRVEKLEANAG